jgi:RNA polymerase sigma factor (sigma-70 family)
MATTQAHPIARYLRQFAATQRASVISDPQLLQRFAGQRDEAAFAALVRRHGPLVLSACRRVLNDWHAAQDCFQATFLLLARKAGSLERPEAVGPWLYGVACRTARKLKAQEARRQACERQAAAPPVVENGDAVVWRDLRPLLDEAVSSLPEKYRVPFILHHLQGVTVAEVARQLGCPQGTIAARLTRAKQRLRRRLAKRGLTVSAAALAAPLSANAALTGVPASLVAETVKAATRLAGEGAAGVMIAAEASKGALPIMGTTRLRIALVSLLIAAAVGVGAGGVRYQTQTALAAPAPANRPDKQCLSAGPRELAQPLSLADLQRLARSNSPMIRQAAADVQAARGAAIQAGAAPNPTLASSSVPGGANVVTVLHLRLAQLDLHLAEIELHRAEADVDAAVRCSYFAVLAAREKLRLARGVARWLDAARAAEGEHIATGSGGAADAAEPNPVAAAARQARIALTRAREHDAATWKRLAGTVGLLTLTPAELAGRLDEPIPPLEYEKIQARVLSNHSDVRVAQTQVQRARAVLQLACTGPAPEVDVKVAAPKDDTTPAGAKAASIPLPVWDRDRGKLLEAQVALLRATEEVSRVRIGLTARLATAFERYQRSRRRVELYRERILPDQARAFREVCGRGEELNEVSAEALAVRQALAAARTAYTEAMLESWLAVADIAALLQIAEP